MGFFRSETLQLFKIVIPEANAYQIISNLGRMGMLHFIDQNPESLPNQKPYSNLLKRCQDLDLNLRKIEDSMKRYEVKVKTCKDLDYFFQVLDEKLLKKETSIENYILEVENNLKSYQKKIERLINSEEEIRDRIILLKERLDLYKSLKDILPNNFK